MRDIHVKEVGETISSLCKEANTCLPADVYAAIEKARQSETEGRAKKILKMLLENADLACRERMAICQDTGQVVVFLKIGQDVHFYGGLLLEAIQQGVRQAYKEGCFRTSVVEEPLRRDNTKDNTPAVIHTYIVPGEEVHIQVMPKGFGSENMSRLAMMKPAEEKAGMVDFVVESVHKAGANPCPPIVVGVGMGGTMEKAALLSKEALLRPIGSANDKKELQPIEEELLDKINEIGIGPQGLGGKTTALAVHIKTYPTHIAGLPVAVNFSCHATRHAERVL